MARKCGIYLGHGQPREPFLHEDRLEEPREPGAEYPVQVVRVVQPDERGVHAFGVEVAKESGGDRAHALYISALAAPQRESMKNVKERSLSVPGRQQER